MRKAKIIFAVVAVGGLFCFFTASAANKMFADTAEDKSVAFHPYEFQTKAQCNFEANLDDADPNGTNIRSKPEKGATILKTIKHDSAVVEITGFSNGWFEISKVEDIKDPYEPEMLFEGRGWIHSSLLSVQTAGPKPRLFAEPTRKSKVLKNLEAGLDLKLVSCKEQWAKVQFGKSIAWLEDHCANPLTICS